MYKLYPYFTNDGSVGLFSPEADDIYHSTYGALSEAYEKFILPANVEKYLDNKKEIKILDICYGIGYNSKSFLNYFFENFTQKEKGKNYNIETIYTNNKKDKSKNFLENIDKIDTNNIIKKTRYSFKNNETIGTNNSFPKIFIHAIDTDKNLVYLSPFFKNKKNRFDKCGLTFDNEKISRMLRKNTEQKYKLHKFINLIILLSVLESHPEMFTDEEFNNLLNDKENSLYFDKSIIDLYKFIKSNRYNYGVIVKIKAFLHNIYYQHISRSYKIALKHLTNNVINFTTEINDARSVLMKSKFQYDIVFLDAFTPAKCPCLWSYEFMCELYKHLDENGIILTYSNSANIRNAFLQAGFYIGKIYNKSSNKFMGTAAVKNKNLISENKFIEDLSDYEIGLINTKAGITYKDPELNLSNTEIINNHKIEVDNSILESSSKYIKRNKIKKN